MRPSRVIYMSWEYVCVSRRWGFSVDWRSVTVSTTLVDLWSFSVCVSSRSISPYRTHVLLASFWPYPFTVAITICTAFLVQIFFTYRLGTVLRFLFPWTSDRVLPRIWRLTDNRGILCLILTLAICTFGLGIVTSVKAWHVKLSVTSPFRDFDTLLMLIFSFKSGFQNW